MEKENKYQRGKIYKVASNKTEDIYIGSTCETLSRRLSQHRQDYKKYLKGKHDYITCWEVLKTDDYFIVLIENYP